MAGWVAAAVVVCGIWNQSGGIRSVADVEKALASSPSAETAHAVAAYLKRTQITNNDRTPNLTRGAMRPPQAFKKVIWFLEAPPTAKVAVAAKSGEKWALKPLGDTGLHVAVLSTPPVVVYRSQYIVDG